MNEWRDGREERMRVKVRGCLKSQKKEKVVRVGDERRETEIWRGGMGIAGVISRSHRGRMCIKLPIIWPENCSEI